MRPIGENVDLTAQSSIVEGRVPRPYSNPRVHSSQSNTKTAMIDFEVYVWMRPSLSLLNRFAKV